MTSTWYPRLLRILAWSLFGLALLVLVVSVFVGIAFYNEYGWNGWGEAISQGWWILAMAAVPAIAGWLLLRIANDSTERPRSGRRP
jgi:uncharacterized membrane protein